MSKFVFKKDGNVTGYGDLKSKRKLHVYIVLAHAANSVDAEVLGVYSNRADAKSKAVKHAEDYIVKTDRLVPVDKYGRYISVLKKSVRGQGTRVIGWGELTILA